MTAQALTIHANTTLAQAARTMAHRQVERLPLIDELGMLGGVVSRADLPKVFVHGDEEIAEEVRREVVVYPFPTPGSAIRVDGTTDEPSVAFGCGTSSAAVRRTVSRLSSDLLPLVLCEDRQGAAGHGHRITAAIACHDARTDAVTKVRYTPSTRAVGTSRCTPDSTVPWTASAGYRSAQRPASAAHGG